MRSLVIGLGEVGSSLAKALSEAHDVQARDLSYKEIDGPIDVMHVCIRHSHQFEEFVEQYDQMYKPKIIDICSTVPPGTTEKFGRRACHSTIRGLHPHLEKSIRTFVKHIGGELAPKLADYYEQAGIRSYVVPTSRTTELCHILSNATYGVNLMLADELAWICRQYGVDYAELLRYNQTSNDGYEKLGHKSKFRMVLSPPQGRIGGHCVRQGARLLEHKGDLLKELVNYGV